MYKPDGKPTRRWFATIGVLLLLIVGVWFNQERGLRSVTEDVQFQALRNCEEVEALKKRVRDAVTEEFARLDLNGELLDIEITPELRAQAKADMESTLRRYAPEDCPRPT